jgi:hypothetical protein
MTNTRRQSIRLAVLALGWCAAAAAQTGLADWERLQVLHPGDQVRVELRGNRTVEALFGAVTDDSLQLVRDRNRQVGFARSEIRRVDRLFHRSRARLAAPWIGAAAGFGIGFAIGYPSGSEGGCWFMCVSKPASGTVVGLVGASVGGVAGYFAKGRKSQLIYRAR